MDGDSGIEGDATVGPVEERSPYVSTLPPLPPSFGLSALESAIEFLARECEDDRATVRARIRVLQVHETVDERLGFRQRKPFACLDRCGTGHRSQKAIVQGGFEVFSGAQDLYEGLDELLKASTGLLVCDHLRILSHEEGSPAELLDDDTHPQKRFQVPSESARHLERKLNPYGKQEELPSGSGLVGLLAQLLIEDSLVCDVLIDDVEAVGGLDKKIRRLELADDTPVPADPHFFGLPFESSQVDASTEI